MRAIHSLRRCVNDEQGATAIEYGLIAGIVMTALISIFGTGNSMQLLYEEVSKVVDAMNDANGG